MGDPAHPTELVVVRMPAELDITNAERVGEELAAAFAPGVWAVIADMTATTFCCSSAVAMLVRTRMRAAANDAELRLVTRSRAVLRALAIAAVDYSLPIYPSLAAALIPRSAPEALVPATADLARRSGPRVRYPGPVSGIHRTRAGHMAVFCNAAPGCRSVWYRPRCASG